jgi:hypothetical protein
MYCQVRKVILWPRAVATPPRIVEFRTGALNVISGTSKTGKSAMIPIIDYCLGAEKCAIPVNTIRNACSWFGVVLATTRGELLLARREPGAQKQTSDMVMLEGQTVEVPDFIETPNANTDQAKELLNELAGLTRLDIDVERTLGRSRGRPSFRDMMAFTFQPQNIVANPNVLFFKADTTEHREKLKAIFPYVLGAITAEGLALQHERKRLQIELRRKERELEGVRSLSARWVAEIAVDVTRARELNLLRQELPRTARPDEMIAVLRDVVARDESEPLLSSQAIGEATRELADLQQEESTDAFALAGLRRRLSAMKDFRHTSNAHGQALSVRRDRLEVSSWIGSLFAERHECPMCGTVDRPVEGDVRRLQAALVEVEAQTYAFERMPAAFDRELIRVEAEVDRATERLNAVRLRRKALEMKSEAGRRRQYDVTAAARFLGHLHDALKQYDQLSASGAVAAEVSALRERLERIEARLATLGERAARDRAEKRFTALAARVVPTLNTEQPDDPVALDLGELTIRVVGKEREDFLWELGSGANWLSYHVAATVALHELFLGLRNSPVPGFTIYDQPSQVYFPRSAPSGAPDARPAPLRTTQASSDESTSPDERTDRPAPDALADATSGDSADALGDRAIAARVSDEDVVEVRRVFRALADAVARMKGRWQAIVLDHAQDDIWGPVEGVHLVEEWRGGRKLVPPAWLSTSPNDAEESEA